jgi:hypothetical protein
MVKNQSPATRRQWLGNRQGVAWLPHAQSRHDLRHFRVGNRQGIAVAIAGMASMAQDARVMT